MHNCRKDSMKKHIPRLRITISIGFVNVEWFPHAPFPQKYQTYLYQIVYFVQAFQQIHIESYSKKKAPGFSIRSFLKCLSEQFLFTKRNQTVVND